MSSADFTRPFGRLFRPLGTAGPIPAKRMGQQPTRERLDRFSIRRVPSFALLALSVLLLGGCPAKRQVVTMPLGPFSYAVGRITARIEQLCEKKKLTEADCKYADDVHADMKKKIDASANPDQDVDYLESFAKLVGIAAKAAI